MIWTVFRIGFLRLLNSPLEMAVMFVVPIVFFSIFALILGRGIGSGKVKSIRVAIIDNDDSLLSRRVVERIRADKSLRGADLVYPAQANASVDDADRPPVVDESTGRSMVRTGRVAAAVLLRQGFDAGHTVEGTPPVGLLADTADPVATQFVSALIHQAVGETLGKARARKMRNRQILRGFLKGSTPPDTQAAKSNQDFSFGDGRIRVRGETDGVPAGGLNVVDRDETTPKSTSPGGDGSTALLDIEDVLAAGKTNPRYSMYAAGIAVLFVLFSASGAGGSLLEEQESGTLERLLSSQLTIGKLMAGKWLFISVLALLQMVVMFAWAQLVFGVDLIGHWQGFLIMATATACASSSLALCLATVCRSRSQLNGVSLILILSMSALGGSMVPRYVMNEEMQRVGLITFNAWALDGFNKVFWRDQSVDSLFPQLAVLFMTTILFGIAARLFAIRWER